jgi:hypothetical protein
MPKRISLTRQDESMQQGLAVISSPLVQLGALHRDNQTRSWKLHHQHQIFPSYLLSATQDFHF